MAAIDPRMMQQLLQLQLFKSFNITGTTSPDLSDNEDKQSFADMLQSMIGQAGTAGKKVIPAAELLRMTSTYMPNVRSANTGTPTTYEPLIQQAAHKYGVDPVLIKAVIQQESSFDPNSVSHAGAKGLMQLMDDTASGYGVTNSFDPQQNIDAGTQFLSGLLIKYNGNEAMALAAYNAGPGRVDRLGVKSDAELYQSIGRLPQETQGFISRVLDWKRQFMQA